MRDEEVSSGLEDGVYEVCRGEGPGLVMVVIGGTAYPVDGFVSRSSGVLVDALRRHDYQFVGHVRISPDLYNVRLVADKRQE